MPQSQFGIKVGQGLERSATARQCPTCGRRGALVSVITPEIRGVMCWWARDYGDRLCTYPGEFFTRAGSSADRAAAF